MIWASQLPSLSTLLAACSLIPICLLILYPNGKLYLLIAWIVLCILINSLAHSPLSALLIHRCRTSDLETSPSAIISPDTSPSNTFPSRESSPPETTPLESSQAPETIPLRTEPMHIPRPPLMMLGYNKRNVRLLTPAPVDLASATNTSVLEQESSSRLRGRGHDQWKIPSR